MAALIGLAVVAGALMLLTSVGQRRRGDGLMTAMAAGLVFPITWISWYVHDEQPYRVRR